MNVRKENNIIENVKIIHDLARHCITYNKVLKHVLLIACNKECSINQFKKTHKTQTLTFKNTQQKILHKHTYKNIYTHDTNTHKINTQ